MLTSAIRQAPLTTLRLMSVRHSYINDLLQNLLLETSLWRNILVRKIVNLSSPPKSIKWFGRISSQINETSEAIHLSNLCYHCMDLATQAPIRSVSSWPMRSFLALFSKTRKSFACIELCSVIWIEQLICGVVWPPNCLFRKWNRMEQWLLTLSRWIKQVLTLSGIEITIFQAHGTRAARASKAS